MYNYSAINNAFYSEPERPMYELHSSWPDDCIPVPDSIYDEFAASEPPPGKYRGVNEEGMPCWLDIPPPSVKEQQREIEAQKQYLIKAANEKIAYLQDAVELEIATDEEASSLKEWKKYRVLLNRLNVNDVNMIFPEQPNTIL